MTILTPASVFRKYETDGVPSSGKHEPKKDEIVQLLEQMSDAGGARYSVATKADLEAITPDTGEQPRGEVLDDATASNNGWYVWDSDTSAWVFERGFPDTFARVTLSGTGTAQTGAVGAGVNPADIEVFFAKVATDNAGAMTLSIGGETARDVVNVAGNALSAGEWTGVVMFFLNYDGDYQLLIDAGAAAAAAQSAGDAAEAKEDAEQALASLIEKYLGAYADDTAATAAAGGTPVTGAEYWNTTDGKRRTWDGSAWQDTGTTLNDGDVTEPKLSRSLSARVGSMLDTVADLIADTTLTYSNIADNDYVEAEGFRYQVAASAATDNDVETAGGVKLYAEPLGGGAVALSQFGAVADGADGSPTDNYAALAQAVATCKARKIDRLLIDGNYAFATTVDLGSSLPVAFHGQPGAKWEAGSTLPQSVLTWIGGADPMFTYANSEDVFDGMAVVNKGSATSFIKYTAGAIRHRMENMSFSLISGASPFSTAIIHSDGNRLGYSRFLRNQIYNGCAPKFIYIEGNGAQGITPFEIGDRSIFGSNVGKPLTVLAVKNCALDGVLIRNSTFNQNDGWDELTIVDTTDTPTSTAIYNLVFRENEIDGANVPSGHLMFKLENVANFACDNNIITGGSSRLHIGRLVNSNLTSCEGNFLYSLPDSMFDLDADSHFNVGMNMVNYSNTRGIINLDAAKQIVDVAFVPSVFINPAEAPGNRPTVFRIEPDASTSWGLNTRTTTTGYVVPGQIIIVRIQNSSGGTINAPSSTMFRLAGSSFGTMPADGHHRDFMFVYDGVAGKFQEISRSTGDVNNA